MATVRASCHWNVVVVLLVSVLHAAEMNQNEEQYQECEIAPELRKEIEGYTDISRKIINAILNEQFKGKTWESLASFVDKFGARMSGTKNLEDAIDFMLSESKAVGLENVHGEEVLVPHWVRGKESATLFSPRVQKLSILGLGGSVGTPTRGIVADVLVVSSFDELRSKAAQANKKIIVFSQDYEGYHNTMVYRTQAAYEAAKVGGVATLIRSLTSFSINSPHTGWQWYEKDIKKIPTACISVEDAEMLLRMARRGERLVIKLKMEAQNLDPVVSRNTVAEIVGHTYPNKTVVVSGHLDSWDVGQGAMDDGGGVFVTWNAMVVLQKLGLRPKRTLRAILWTAEEVGLVGAISYANAHANESKNLNFVMELDGGTFTPIGFSFSGTERAGCIMREILRLLSPINATKFTTPQFGGTDISVWTDYGIPGASFFGTDELYYWFHHTRGDTMSVLDARSLDLCTAAWTVVAYIIADLSADMRTAD